MVGWEGYIAGLVVGLFGTKDNLTSFKLALGVAIIRPFYSSFRSINCMVTKGTDYYTKTIFSTLYNIYHTSLTHFAHC